MAVNVRVVGNVEASSTVEVRALVTGELLTVNFKEGDDVVAGQPLFNLDPRPFQVALEQAQAALQRDTAQARGAAAQLSRSDDLLKRGLVAPSDHDATSTTAASSEATVAADTAAVDNARLQLQYAKIASPVSGRTGALLVHQGSLVHPTDTSPLVIINQFTPVFVSFAAPANLLPANSRRAGARRAQRQGVSGRHEWHRRLGHGELHRQRRGSGDEHDSSERRRSRTRIACCGRARSSTSRLQLSVDPHAIVAPSAAVQVGQQGQYIYVVKPDQTVEIAAGHRGLDGRRPDGRFRRACNRRHGRDGRTAQAESGRENRGQTRNRSNAGRQPDESDAMNISEVFIRRPVATTLIQAAIVIFGVVGYRALPVSDLPTVDFPTIQVSAGLPGADPETMASAVATPLEKQFATIAGISSISSTSTLGSTQISLQFDLSRNIDAAAQDVQIAISRTTRSLPPQMPTPPSFQKVNPADSPILFLTLSSQTLPLSTVDEYAETNVGQRISVIDGVAQVQVYGAQKFAVRIDVDPQQLATRNIGIADLATSIVNGNANVPGGTLYGPDKTFSVVPNGQLENAAAFRPLIVAYSQGRPVHLEEVANVYDGVENDKTASWFNDSRTVYLSVQRQPGTNTVEIVDAIRATLNKIQAELPASVSLAIRSDRSQSIRESVGDVKFTLVLTIVLVILVIFLFLRNISATVIPSLALPASIVGTFAVMYLLNYSLDNLSMMALTLSVGFVVDDAIVMLENIVRHMEHGEDPLTAALNGSKEIAFTIVSMTLSLAAVFIPILFMGGIIGRLLHEFAVTIGVSILVSGFVSISLTPMLSARFLRPPGEQKHGRLYNATERVFDDEPAWLRVDAQEIDAAPRPDHGASRCSSWPPRPTASRSFPPDSFRVRTSGS